MAIKWPKIFAAVQQEHLTPVNIAVTSEFGKGEFPPHRKRTFSGKSVPYLEFGNEEKPDKIRWLLQEVNLKPDKIWLALVRYFLGDTNLLRAFASLPTNVSEHREIVGFMIGTDVEITNVRLKSNPRGIVISDVHSLLRLPEHRAHVLFDANYDISPPLGNHEGHVGHPYIGTDCPVQSRSTKLNRNHSDHLVKLIVTRTFMGRGLYK